MALSEGCLEEHVKRLGVREIHPGDQFNAVTEETEARLPRVRFEDSSLKGIVHPQYPYAKIKPGLHCRLLVTSVNEDDFNTVPIKTFGSDDDPELDYFSHPNQERPKIDEIVSAPVYHCVNGNGKKWTYIVSTPDHDILFCSEKHLVNFGKKYPLRITGKCNHRGRGFRASLVKLDDFDNVAEESVLSVIIGERLSEGNGLDMPHFFSFTGKRHNNQSRKLNGNRYEGVVESYVDLGKGDSCYAKVESLGMRNGKVFLMTKYVRN